MKNILLLTALAVFTACSPKVKEDVSESGSELGFSLSLFRNALKLARTDANVSVSPYSAGVAVSMVAEGAEGETRVEFDNALNGCLFRNADLGGNDTVKVISANSAWLNDDFAVRNNYVNLLAKDYGALATAYDFADPATLKAINNWCSEHTEGLVDNVLGKLTGDMKLVLVNALYFKAPWLNPFNPAFTRDAVFHGSKGDRTVSFMSGKVSCEYVEYAGNQFIRLPYEGERYSMYILLPSAESSPEEVVPYITENGLKEVMAHMAPSKVNLRMPKFKVESDMSLVKTLEAMGIRTAFTTAADLGGIAHGPLYVSEVVQKTVVDVNERGSEAAAATAAVIQLTSARPEKIPSMTIDRPFYYMIADMDSQRILFAGRIMNL